MIHEDAVHAVQHRAQPHAFCRRNGDCENRPSVAQLHKRPDRRLWHVGVRQYGVAVSNGIARFAARDDAGQGCFINVHVGERSDDIAVLVDDRRIRRCLPVEKDRGQIIEPCRCNLAGDQIAFQIAASHRKEVHSDAELRGIARRVEDAAANFLAHAPRIGCARHMGNGQLPAPVNVRAAY
jgi:hypothetical protein